MGIIDIFKGLRQCTDTPAKRVSLKAKLEAMKAKVAVKFFDFYSQHVISILVGNKSWVTEAIREAIVNVVTHRNFFGQSLCTGSSI